MSKILSGCPHIQYNEQKNCEVCSLTGRATGVSLLCDFDYDTCTFFKKNISRPRGQKPASMPGGKLLSEKSKSTIRANELGD